MGKETALIVIEELKPEVVSTEQGLDNILKEVREKATAFVFDADTPQGRKDIVSLAYRVSLSKKPLDDVLEKEKEDAKEKVKRINGLRNKATDFLDTLRDEIRKPVTEYEEEQARIKKEQEEKEAIRIAEIKQMIVCISNHSAIEYSETSEAIEQRIKLVEAMEIDEKYEEFQEEARQTKESVLTRLNTALEQALNREKEDAEREAEKKRLAKIAEEQAAEKARQAEAQAKIDAENKRIADEKRKADEALEREKAELAKQKRQGRIDRLINAGLDYDDIKGTFSLASIGFFESSLMGLTDAEFDAEIKKIINMIENEKTRLKKEQEEREQKEREEAERQEKLKAEAEEKKRKQAEAMLPDREKMKKWIYGLEGQIHDDFPEFSTEKAENFFHEELLKEFNDFFTDMLDKVDNL